MKWLKRYRWLLPAAVLISGCLLTEHWAYQRVVPPAGVRTLDDFLAWQPGAGRFTAADLRDGGGEHLIAYGKNKSLIVFPSGPSAYAFDRDRRLADWAADVGDDSAFNEKWLPRSAYSDRGLTRAEAAAWPTDCPGG